MKRLMLFVKKLALVLGSSLLAFAAAEVVLRVYRPSYDVGIPDSYTFDEELNFRLRPGAHLFRTTDFQQESVVNALGTANFQEGFAGYERLVFAVGDSYTQGIGVAADQSYPFQLDLTLNRDAEGFYAKRFGVVNLGVGGYGGEQNLIVLGRAAERLGKPAVILYLGCDNDFEDDLMFTGGHRRRAWNFEPWRWLKTETQVGVKVKRFFFSRQRAALREAVLGPEGVGGDEKPSAAELQRTVLERLAERAREHGALLVVGWSDEGRSYEWLKSWAGARGVAFADWSPRAKSVMTNIAALPLDNHHTGDHHRGWTNRVIAEEFARHIEPPGARPR